ncbi:surface lipoprotein assembly modifier [Congregibacter sp.]|uniref:surface lipoprotein assembly modifier n=1 Tax=Congregibacter sp. TaxID=2744308 RepID=UPI00385F7C80
MSKTRWSAEVGLGGEYDTNVSVDEVDLSSGQSDYAAIIDLELGVQHEFSEKTEASLNYDVSKSSYQEFSAVDRLTHILGADINTDLGSSNASLSAYYIDSRLDGDAFLKYTRISPSLSGFFSQRWFARGAYVYSERSIDNRSQRDAETQTGEIDFYYFHRGLRSYFNVGYRYRDEDAVADELDFDAHSLKLRYIRRFDAGERKIKVEAALRYEVRDYSSDEPTIGEPRDDDRTRVKLDLEVPLTKRLNWQWYLSYGDYVSNLPRADFTQTILGTRLQYSW